MKVSPRHKDQATDKKVVYKTSIIISFILPILGYGNRKIATKQLFLDFMLRKFAHKIIFLIYQKKSAFY